MRLFVSELTVPPGTFARCFPEISLHTEACTDLGLGHMEAVFFCFHCPQLD